MLHLVTSWQVTIVIDILAWAVVHAGTGYVAHRLSPRRLARDGWLLRDRPFEDAGRWYRRRLRVDRWKAHLPEAGDFFRGGINKRHLPAADSDGLALFVRETRRGELAHWWALAFGPVFSLWNPPLAAGLLLAYGVAINLPFVIVLRYNRFRALALIHRRDLAEIFDDAT